MRSLDIVVGDAIVPWVPSRATSHGWYSAGWLLPGRVVTKDRDFAREVAAHMDQLIQEGRHVPIDR